MKKILLGLCLFAGASSLFASSLSNLTYYNLGGFETSFKKELSSGIESQRLIKKAKKNSSFQRAYKILNEHLKAVNSFKDYDTSKFLHILDYLKAANTEYADWIGLNLFMQVEKSITIKDKYKKYGLYFAKRVRKHNLCGGYLAEGIYLKKIDSSLEKQIDILEKGISNKCRGTKYEKFYLTANKNIALHYLKNKD